MNSSPTSSLSPRRALVVAAVAGAAGLGLAGSALAASSHAARSSVSVRVEGATKTLLGARTVTAPTSGSVTKGGAPAGKCPANSAAGALNLATGGRWNGAYSKYGIEVDTILGTTLSYAKGSYWAFYVNDHYASTGVCATKLRQGDSLLFAAVPAKGKTPLPLIATAPATARVGRPITVDTFVYPGAGSATRQVSGAELHLAENVKHPLFGLRSGGPGRWRVTARKPGTVTLFASATGDIRSAATTITVAG